MPVVSDLIAVAGAVSGRVQGVGFRVSARWAAERVGVTGWARNLADGRVEVFAQGPLSRVDEFVEWLAVGPQAARVDAVRLTPVEVDPTIRRFTIR